MAKKDDPALRQCGSVGDFWALIIAEMVKQETDEGFEKFCGALLLSSLICQKRGLTRVYPTSSTSKGPTPALNQYRRRLHAAATARIDGADNKVFSFISLSLVKVVYPSFF